MRWLTLVGFLVFGVTIASSAETVNWPQFRGADSDGLAEGATLPETWSTTENVVWKADVPGWGWSSPVIWGEKIFVTSAVGENERAKLVVGGYPGGHVKPNDVCVPLLAQEPGSVRDDAAQGDSWTKVLKDRSKRGTLHDTFEKVRGDSGKWNDEPSLQHAPPINRKPPKLSLDDWADQLRRTRRLPPTANEDTWLLFKTRQLDDNDRVWIERIERKGNQFTIVLSEAIWQGRYSKTFTYYNVFGVNLGKLAPGKYEAKWIIEPLVFRAFEGSGGPTDERRKDNWPKDERPAEKKSSELSVAFTVVAASQ